MLDADEYFHLALHASSIRDPHACMSYLEGVLELQPCNARALYLRAVQHADLGLGERALSGMRAALASDPNLEIARFHLGLLLLMEGHGLAEARQHLQALSSAAHEVLRTYAAVLLAIADECVVSERDSRIRTLAQLLPDEPLAAAMQRLLDSWRTDRE